jgi:hypothetical protein
MTHSFSERDGGMSCPKRGVVSRSSTVSRSESQRSLSEGELAGGDPLGGSPSLSERTGRLTGEKPGTAPHGQPGPLLSPSPGGLPPSPLSDGGSPGRL